LIESWPKFYLPSIPDLTPKTPLLWRQFFESLLQVPSSINLLPYRQLNYFYQLFMTTSSAKEAFVFALEELWKFFLIYFQVLLIRSLRTAVKGGHFLFLIFFCFLRI
jgi:hypothetical protein